MEQTRRERLRTEMVAGIKETAWQQIGQEGAAALSLRAIAREMGISAPALYRYFAGRDELVTALIIDAYNALADAMEIADSAMNATDYNGRFQAIAHTYRQWALAHPQDFTLIYGTPIPGYQAPPERTIAPAARVLQAIGLLLAEAEQAGKLSAPSVYQILPQALHQTAAALTSQLPVSNVSPAVIALTMILWSTLYGLVWGELYGHFPPGLAEAGELYQVEVQAICHRLRLGDAHA